MFCFGSIYDWWQRVLRIELHEKNGSRLQVLEIKTALKSKVRKRLQEEDLDE
jgi:hypothetical protein